MTSTETRVLSTVLARLTRTACATADDCDYPGEWFRIESNDHWDYELYSLLKKKWYSLTFPYSSQFALIYCESGLDNGVWLHYLPSPGMRAEFLCGPHYVPEW